MSPPVERLGPVAWCGDFAAFVGSVEGVERRTYLGVKRRDAEGGILSCSVFLDDVAGDDAIEQLAKHMGDEAGLARRCLEAALQFNRVPPVGTN